jgi:hypothetical protein
VKNVGKKIINFIYKLEKKYIKKPLKCFEIDGGRMHDSYFHE